jgi:G3E family GTPase
MTSSPPSSEAAEPDGVAERSDIPVTVIGGYLGSGKTTLVNHLLRTGDERVAVLVNDFGDVDIDGGLIERDDGDTIALANGCICCSLVDGFAAALDTIRALDPRPDRLVIEASGVADPANVAAYGHGPELSLDAVIVLVDAETIRRLAVDRYVADTVLGQLSSADVVVVNKIDLVDRAEVDEVLAWLADRVDRALIVEATGARVDPAVLFGRLRATGGRRPGGGPGASTHDRADDRYQAWSWQAADGRVLDREVIDRLMADLPDEVVRAKGIVWLPGEDGPRRHVLQRVGRRWTLWRARPRAGSPSGPADDPSRLVLIGQRDAVADRWLADRLDA